MQKIAIIGAGGAGLAAGRHCLEQNLPFEIFEQTGNVGGTWNYTDCVGSDENGLPVHSSMYHGLITNLPKEVMTFEKFPHPDQQKSYIPQQDVINYLRRFSEKFHIDDHIKFWTKVTKVVPRANSWLIEYDDLKSKQKSKQLYTAVMICNGHYSSGFVPEIDGIEHFDGHYTHSQHYRKPNIYEMKNVLIIGAGPSGSDIAQHVAKFAKTTYVSLGSKCFTPLPEIIKQKPRVIEFQPKTAIFSDGTTEKIDEILFCTGYNFSFPFLTEDCQIQYQDNYVRPLYKQIINIEFPTMAFIGLNMLACPFPLFDIQVRFFLATINGHYKLPPKEEMLEELNNFITTKGSTLCKFYHALGESQGQYFTELANTANIEPIPPVIQKLYQHVRKHRDLSDCFKIVDRENWEQIH